MINQCELRIGDLVDLYDSVTGHNFVKVSISILSANEFIDPIPLTPEILVKCGFKKTGYSNSFSFGKIISNWELEYNFYENGTDEFYINPNDGFSDSDNFDIIQNCKYLHQLQNLYFALTGEELQINL